MKWRLFCLFTAAVLGSLVVRAQDGVIGTVPITLVDGGTDCNGLARIVEIHADVSGLVGNGGAALGLNGFVLVINLSRTDVFASAIPGNDPLVWNMVSTERNFVTTQVTLAGWCSEMDAPNQSYHLANLILAGNSGSVTVSLSSESQLASRLVSEGNGPANIGVSLPSGLTLGIPVNFPFTFHLALPSWRHDDPTYDFEEPSPFIDLLDLVKLMGCAPP